MKGKIALCNTFSPMTSSTTFSDTTLFTVFLVTYPEEWSYVSVLSPTFRTNDQQIETGNG